ncbi:MULTISPECIES: porin [unclassified Burkholderia]|uniref:porin n=1 Tax=unclassified Burkholderia TaxID=2613784 RepID=UPI000F56A3E7|nr:MULTISPECIES: porin [unclassified Burkholderia]RQR70519.1 porin [Burkholderia sp. Bp9011]RQR83595.1 porin [Burkholderia sp. Bp9010]RQS64141.1 porin [Burkholderia sp. Bp8977]
MKNPCVKAMIVAAGVVTSQAYAENSVTLYGVVDTGFMYIHNSGGKSTQFMMASGTESGSRWGVKGSEDLGGGLKTIFQIENGFNSTTGNLGQGGRMFGRQAYVGLSDASTWGTITLGRQYDPLIDLVQPVQGDNYLGGFFSSPGDIDNADNSVRINSAVKWSSPSWSGLQLSAMYSFGGVAGTIGSGQTYSGAAAYTNGPLAVAAGFLHIDNGNGSVAQRAKTSADSLFNSSVNAAYASARSVNIARAGGRYALGDFSLGGYYSYSQYNPDAASAFNRSEKYHNGSVYALWQVSPALLTEIGYNYLRSLGDSSAKYHQVSIGADYNLSKRTDVYAVASYGHATGQNGAGPAQAVIGSIDVDAGKSSQAIATVGLRHRF